jgi:DNA-binding MarR family transcriptional regulator
MASGTPSAERIAVWRAFLEAHARVTDALDADLRESHDLPLTWYDVLVHLSEAPGGRLRMAELASAVLFSRSGLTRLIDRMESRGYVRREPCADDARGMFARLTPAGRAALRRAAPAHLRGVERLFTGRLPDRELRALGAALKRVLDDGLGRR